MKWLAIAMSAIVAAYLMLAASGILDAWAAERAYGTSSEYGTDMNRCVKAEQAATAWARVGSETKFERWSHKAAIDCLIANSTSIY